MTDTDLHYAGSRTTSAILRFTLSTLPHPHGLTFTNGLPAGSMLLTGASLLLGGTPCTVPMFRAAMERSALDTGWNVLIARHGTHPEVLDPVVWDVMIWSGDRLNSINDLILYVAKDGSYSLLPSTPGPHIRLAADGLHLDARPHVITWPQRSEGVGEAARRIIAATRGSRV